MKKSLLLFSAVGMLAVQSMAQAPRYVLFEHFTQASCGPCAAQNPGFQSTILNPNPDIVRHIAYHTSWPGTDPMYTYNSSENGARTSFYGVTGVPDIFMQGNFKEAQPGGFAQTDVDNTFSTSSPIKIKVSEVDNGNNRDVTIDILTLATPPAGSYKVYLAVVEDPVTYGTPPGSNGETVFPNVFRNMVTAIGGDAVTLPSVGNTLTLNYNYVEDGVNWNLSNIKVIAWVQHASTKEVLNVGTVNDPNINYTLGAVGADANAGTTGNVSTFNLSSMNTGNSTEDFVYTLTSDAPGDWAGSFTINGNTYASTATVNFTAGSSQNITVDVTPGATPAVATYTLEVSSVQNPSFPSMKTKVYVISNVTDLLVNSTGSNGVTAGDASLWENSYLGGLTLAGNTGIGKTNEVITQKLAGNSALSGVNNIYYNVGWTFPAFTSDNVVTVLQNFLNAGGNLMICGQDLGWDTWDTGNGGNGTAATQSFYTNYLHASFVADGGGTNTSLIANSSDIIYGAVPTMGIVNYYGSGTTNYYPDEINATATGNVIFTYNTTSKKAGVRSDLGTYKTVYMGIGMEMLSTANADALVKLTHDWFYGLVSTEEYDMAVQNLGQNFPNPANSYTTIPVNELNNNSTLLIMDMSGKLVYSVPVNAGTSAVSVPVSQLGAGVYQYFLQNDNGITASKRMTVVK